MEWIILSLGAAFLFTAANLIDKFVITDELRDPYIGTTLCSFISGLVFITTSILLSTFTTDLKAVLPGIMAGIVSAGALWFYFSILSKEEVSRTIPILGTIPLFVLPFGYLLFEEVFTPLTYLGVGLVIAGSILISFKKRKEKIRLNFLILLAIVSALLFAFRNVLIKFSTQTQLIWPVMLWIGVGGLISSLSIFTFHHPKLREKGKKGVEHLALSALITSLATIFMFIAIAIGPVSLVSTIVGINPMLVLIFATAITILHPSFIHEKINRKALIQKTISTLMIIIGATLIILL